MSERSIHYGAHHADNEEGVREAEGECRRDKKKKKIDREREKDFVAVEGLSVAFSGETERNRQI